MNREGRTVIRDQVNRLQRFTLLEVLMEMSAEDRLEALDQTLENVEAVLEELMDDEQSKLDSMSEGLQSSPTGEAITEAIDQLDGVLSELGHARLLLEDLPDDRDIDWAEGLAETITEVISELKGI
jgi:hypothetical protein